METLRLVGCAQMLCAAQMLCLTKGGTTHFDAGVRHAHGHRRLRRHHAGKDVRVSGAEASEHKLEGGRRHCDDADALMTLTSRIELAHADRPE